MKRIINSSTVKAIIATGLCGSFVLYPALRISAKATYAGGDVRSESQIRSEATRYESAMRAIAAVASMKLENPDELKKALAILDREGSHLKFHVSKLIVLGLNDSTFTSAIKKAAPDKAAAEALVKQLRLDPRAVLKLDGAQPLVARLRQNTQADAATLRRVSERFKEAAAKSGRSDTGNQSGEGSDLLSRVGDFYTFILVLDLLVDISGMVAAGDFFAEFFAALLAFEECMEAVNKRRTKCLVDVHKQPISDFGAEARCGFNWAVQAAECERRAMSMSSKSLTGGTPEIDQALGISEPIEINSAMQCLGLSMGRGKDLPHFLSDILEDMFDGSDAVRTVGFAYGDVTIAAHRHLIQCRRDGIGLA